MYGALPAFLSTLSLRRATLWAFSDGSGFLFLSTLSLRRATRSSGPFKGDQLHFYPRSPCGERLHSRRSRKQRHPHFYPRSPCGERRINARYTNRLAAFLSTLSLRRATTNFSGGAGQLIISIHALLAESDNPHSINCMTHMQFLSTLSLRRATDLEPSSTRRLTFLSTLSLRRATRLGFLSFHNSIFLSTLSLRRATRFYC